MTTIMTWNYRGYLGGFEWQLNTENFEVSLIL